MLFPLMAPEGLVSTIAQYTVSGREGAAKVQQYGAALSLLIHRANETGTYTLFNALTNSHLISNFYGTSRCQYMF